MTTTVRVSATTSADTNQTFDIASGASRTFAADGLSGDEEIVIERLISGSYRPLTIFEYGQRYAIKMQSGAEVVRINGPFDDLRINKPETANSTQVVEYS